MQGQIQSGPEAEVGTVGLLKSSAVGLSGSLAPCCDKDWASLCITGQAPTRPDSQPPRGL